MPILDLQRKWRQRGRIRIGAKVPTARGGSRPDKLDVFRFTSDEASIRAVAALYGGEPKAWTDGPDAGLWEVVTTAKDIPVILPPSELAFSQWLELWSGGGCQRRCDGVRMVTFAGAPVDAECVCDPDNRDCKPKTRVSLILPDLDGVGLWRLDSGGGNAAGELAGSIEIAGLVSARGVVRARLKLENRSRKVPDPKSSNGGVMTLRFVVPVLDLVNVSAGALTAGEQPALATADRPALSPVPSEDAPPRTVAEQIEAVEHKEAKTRRGSSAPPSTGLAPRQAGRHGQQGSTEKPSEAPAGDADHMPTKWRNAQIIRLAHAGIAGEAAVGVFLFDVTSRTHTMTGVRPDEAAAVEAAITAHIETRGSK